MRARGDEGFTLVETVVSIALFAVIATAATFAIVSSVRAAEATELRVAAGHVAEQQLARIVALGAEPAATPETPDVSGDGRTYTVDLVADPAYDQPCVDGVRDIAVIVTAAPDSSRPVSARLDTRLACEPETADAETAP